MHRHRLTLRNLLAPGLALILAACAGVPVADHAEPGVIPAYGREVFIEQMEDMCLADMAMPAEERNGVCEAACLSPSEYERVWCAP